MSGRPRGRGVVDNHRKLSRFIKGSEERARESITLKHWLEEKGSSSGKKGPYIVF